MTFLDWKSTTTPELLHYFGSILDELKQRGVVRTRNNPISDYAEWLLAQHFYLQLKPNSNPGFDAVDTNGRRYQIKSRRLDKANESKRLSVIRNLEKHEFDYLICLLFDNNFDVLGAYKIPYDVVKRYAKPNKHQNGHILYLQGDVLKTRSVEDISLAMKQ